MVSDPPADAIVVRSVIQVPQTRSKVWVEWQFDRPIMGQIDRAPIGIKKVKIGWSSIIAGLGEVHYITPRITQIKFPTRIQLLPLPNGISASRK